MIEIVTIILILIGNALLYKWLADKEFEYIKGRMNEK